MIMNAAIVTTLLVALILYTRHSRRYYALSYYIAYGGFVFAGLPAYATAAGSIAS